MTVLNLKNIEKSYPSPKGGTLQILQDINLKIEKGETIAIIGRSGSGKSTLLSLMAGLEKPSSGTIEINQEQIATFSEQQLANFRKQTLGIVFQQFHLMPYLNALENVALPLELQKNKQAQKIAATWLDKIGLKNRKTHYPSQLSGGEKQRVAIARALINNPTLLLADEPTGNLDEATGEEISQILFELVKEKQMTLILVTHNKELAQVCDKRFLLQQGVLNEITI